MSPRIRLASAVAAFGAVALSAACSNPNALAPPSLANVVDTIVLTATRDSSLQAPNAFSITNSTAVRSYQTVSFEFAYDITPAGQPVILPLAVLGLSPGTGLKPGLLLTATAFDAITVAPANGYVTTDTIPIAVGQTYFLRSRQLCSTLGLPEYGKIAIDSLDPVLHTVRFRALMNENCGYRSLLTGLPKN
ncbi:MAG: hypothetical protein ABJD11_05675 [Gemmatimonadota bacterium]